MRSLIIGGTQGLGYALAQGSLLRGIEPIVTGQKPEEAGVFIGDVEVRREHVRVEDDADVAWLMQRFKVTPSLDFRYLFYLPATHLKGMFVEQKVEDVNRLLAVTVGGLLNVVRHFHRMKGKPYHLVIVTSTTSWKIRPDEAVYGMAKAAQAQFGRNFHQELVAKLPGSKTLIVHPGGMRTHFLDASGIDSSSFLNPAIVAEHIWEEIRAQEAGTYPALHELHLLRRADGDASLERGVKTPE
jgi:NAD(P)-dependent dehydrogenase (short-subunit alcohol dehydrogenase family)